MASPTKTSFEYEVILWRPRGVVMTSAHAVKDLAEKLNIMGMKGWSLKRIMPVADTFYYLVFQRDSNP